MFHRPIKTSGSRGEKLDQKTKTGTAAKPGKSGAAASNIGHPLTSPPTER